MQSGRGNRNAALLGALVLAAVALVAFVFLFQWGRSVPRGAAESPEPSALVTESPSTSPDASESPPEAGIGRTATEATSNSPAAPISTGVLHLEFVSTLDGSHVADLPFLVYRERGGDKVLARGRSDARGRADVRDLEENVILVLTPRSPPFASKVEACWLGRAETKDLIVGLDGGARVVGRVVDDAQHPVEGAEVLVAADYATESPTDPLDREHPAVVTGPDGKFAVDQMASRPRGVWIVDGRMRPERWEAAELFVRKECAIARKVPDVKPGTTFDLGDVMLERCSTLAGTVLDSDNRPVSGALVSWRTERHFAHVLGTSFPAGDPHGFRIPPGREGFRLQSRETMTDPIGAFEMRASLQDNGLAVWAPSGQYQDFVVPKVQPSERVDGLVLRLDAITMLEVELLDRSGARVTSPGPTAREKGLRVWGRGQSWTFPGAAVAGIRLAEGKHEEVRTSADPDGLFRFQLKTPPSRVQAIALNLAGYETIEDDLAGRLQPVTRLSYVLRETPALRIRLTNKPTDGTRARSGDLTSKLSLQICLASPEQRRDMTTHGCCGLGAWVWFNWTNEPRDFVLPAIAPRPYWVYLRGSVRGLDAASFGPFESGDTVHEIEADLGRITVPPAPEREPPEESGPGKTLPSAYVTARAVDSRDDQLIRRFTIAGRRIRDGKETDYFAFSPFEEDGKMGSKRLAPGLWNFTVGAQGYRRVAIANVFLVEDQHKDLGTVDLEPLPTFHARIVEEDRSPAPRGTWVRVTDAAATDEEPQTAATDVEGRIVLNREIGEQVLLEIFEPIQEDTEEGGGAQRFLVRSWLEDAEKEIRLSRWQRVEVRVGGAAIDPPGTALFLGACPAVGDPVATCDHREAVREDHEPLLRGRETDATSTRRVYRFRMSAGRYQVYGRDLLHEVPAQDIEVHESDEVQVFELTSR